MLLSETPASEVTIAPYWMDRYEVTNTKFQSFIRAKPEWRKARVSGNYLQHWNADQFAEGQADFPVVFVTWPAALAYAEWAGKRLPTEAEWEFAARGRNALTYPWGDQKPTRSLANYTESGVHAPVRVGSYPPNPYGVFDLGGNVWEFCLDQWGTHPGGARRQSESDVRRMRGVKAERRVIRGGSFDGSAFNMRATARDSHRIDNPVGHVGFRCVRSA